MVTESVALDNLHGLKLLQTGLLADLVLSFVSIMLEVTHVRYVPDVTDLVAKMTEELEQHIIGHARAGMAKMGISVHGRAADIHSDMPFVDRNE